MKLIIAIIGFVLAGGIFVLYTEPTYASVGQLQSQISQYNQALAESAQLSQLNQTLLNRYNSLDPNAISRLETMLPDNVDNIGLILDLDNLANAHGMALENINVSDTSDSSDASDDQTAQTVGTDQPYGSITLEFTTYGSYSDFESFITGLESSLRIVDLVSIQITPESGTSAGLYKYDLVVETYWLK